MLFRFSVAVGYQLLGQYKEALRATEAYIKIQKDHPTREDSCGEIETHEMVMYYISLLVESNNPVAAMQYLEENKALVVDSVAFLETAGAILLMLGKVFKPKLKRAEEMFRALIKRNPENKQYVIYPPLLGNHIHPC